MAHDTYSGDWRTDAHAIHNQEGSHYDLARWVEGKGFEVVADPDDLQRSFVARPGNEDFEQRIIGEITGDEEARVNITELDA